MASSRSIRSLGKFSLAVTEVKSAGFEESEKPPQDEANSSLSGSSASTGVAAAQGTDCGRAKAGPMRDFEPSEATTEVLGTLPQQQIPYQRQLCLVVVTGADKGVVFTLKPGTYTLGRSAQHADFVINGRGLSRAHARVTVDEADIVTVLDLESTNGVFVNGVKIEQISLSSGDTLTLGPEVSLRLDAPDQTIQTLLNEMQRGATQDGLTGLLNRASFMQRLNEEASLTARHSLQTGLAILDVDHFKKVNDTYGHSAGDAVLVEVANRLTSAVRGEDVVARYGGEEFVILMRYTNLEGCGHLLERVRSSIASQPFRILGCDGDTEITVTISIGLAQFGAEINQAQLLEQADQALYEAKRSGRNRLVVAGE